MHNIQILIFTYWLYCYFRDVIRLPTTIHHVYSDENCEAKVFGLKYGVNSCDNAFDDNVCEAMQTPSTMLRTTSELTQEKTVLGLNSGGDIIPAPTYLRAKKDL